MGKEGSAKTDAMRKQREEQHAERERRAKEAAKVKPVTVSNESSKPMSVSFEGPKAQTKTIEVQPGERFEVEIGKGATKMTRIPADPRKAPGPGEGRCSVCGKLRAVKLGRIVAHQKGLGTPCPGSKKAPA